VPGIVQSRVPDAGLSEKVLPGVVIDLRMHWTTEPVREHPALFYPEVRGAVSVAFLTGSVPPQDVHERAGDQLACCHEARGVPRWATEGVGSVRGSACVTEPVCCGVRCGPVWAAA